MSSSNCRNSGNIPLVVAQFINQPPFGLCRLKLEGSVKRLVGCVDAQVGIQTTKGSRVVRMMASA